MSDGADRHADQIKRIYRSLLGREPEAQALANAHDPLDVALSVARSPEYRQRIEADYQARLGETQDYWITPTANGHLVTHLADEVIGRAIRHGGAFQESDVARLLDLSARTGLGVGKEVFVDVGSNIGTHTLSALNAGFGRALCIEPDPTNFRILRANQVLNGWDGRCINVAARASDRSGTAELGLSTQNFGDHRLHTAVPQGGLYDEDTRATVQVDLARLDEIVANAGLNTRDIGLVWIDTQGHEGQVLAGMRGIRAELRAPIVLEFWPYGLERSGNFELLKREIGQRPVHDLSACLARGDLAGLGCDSLDDLFVRLRGAERAEAASFTDLLLL